MGKTVLLFGAAAVLLVLSTVGSARAALTYYSENYEMQVSVSYIGVSLEENGKTVSSRSYDADNNVTEVTGKLLENLGETAGAEGNRALLPGKKYDENLSVTNRGQIDSYVRVIVRKSWMDKEGKKNTALSPDLICLDMDQAGQRNNWIKDESASAGGSDGVYRERMVLYYALPLKPGEATETFNEAIGVDYAVTGAFSQTVDGNVTTTVYDYDGYAVCLEVEVDAVQTHNGADAVKSAWGTDVEIAPDGRLRLR